MQFAFIITHIDAYTTENSGQSFSLSVRDYSGRQLLLLGNAEQQVNILTLKHQALPCLMLSDQIEQNLTTSLSFTAQALISIVPFSSREIQALLDAGKASELLKNFKTIS